MTNTVKVEDFKQWVMSQPDDKKVDMLESDSTYPCGCTMVQYGKEVLKIDEDFKVGSYSWFGESRYIFENEVEITKIFYWNRAVRVTNYGALKETMR